MSREHIERVVAERMARADATAGAHDAQIALRAMLASHSIQALLIELQHLAAPSVPYAYADAYVEAVWAAVFNGKEIA